MYKFLLAILVFIFFIGSANAQIFVGGSVNFSASSNKIKTDGDTEDGTKSFSFGLNPKAGYFMNDKLAFGVGLGLTFNRNKTPGDPEIIQSSSQFSINPFARYYAIELGDLKVFAEGGINLGFGVSKTKNGDITADGPKTTAFMLYVSPALSYDINEKLTIEGIFGNVYFQTNRSKQEAANITNKHINSGFGFNLKASSISFGFIYKL